MQALAPVLVDWLLQQGYAHIYRKDDADERSCWLAGGLEEAACREDGFTLYVRPESGQKTGYYLDQRENRRALAPWLRGLRVLNAFSYTGGFALHALRAGAAEVVSVDASAALRPVIERQLAANFSAPPPHHFEVADCFDYLRHCEAGAFQAIILDPPAFTKHRSTVERAARGYKDLNLRAIKLLPAGGLLATFSCSQHVGPVLFRQILFAAAADAGRRVRLVGAFGHGPDHPVDVFHPEGEYLKGWLLEIGE
jgi:23S rRNA (cytosine1962-C5)-methyltransferase